MAIDVRPATVFDDAATMVGPKRPGTRALFEKAGFRKAAGTTSVINGFPRVLMRLELR